MFKYVYPDSQCHPYLTGSFTIHKGKLVTKLMFTDANQYLSSIIALRMVMDEILIASQYFV